MNDALLKAAVNALLTQASQHTALSGAELATASVEATDLLEKVKAAEQTARAFGFTDIADKCAVVIRTLGRSGL